MPIANNGAVNIHWEEQGQGETILLIMGHRYSSAMWYPVWDAFAAAGYHVIRYDNRGTGRTDAGGRFTIEDLARDAIAVLDAAGVDKANVYGVSMGGVIAEELARAHPERVKTLILGCTGIQSPDKPRMPAAMRLLYYAPSWLLRALLGNRSGYGSAAPDDAVARDRAMLAADPFDVNGVVAQARAIATYNITREAVAAMTMPALVLHGDEDRAVKFEWGQELAATLPDSRFVHLHGAGHNYFVARGAEANAAVLQFLDEHST